MTKLSPEVYDFFNRQGFVLVSTLDSNNSIHISCKGLVKVDKNGTLYLLDLYLKKTFENLKDRPSISIAAVHEHGFSGYCLKGKAKLVDRRDLPADILRSWEEKINSRISRRLIKNIKGEAGHPRHPEAAMPTPQYMIAMEVHSVIDLTPAHLK